MRKLNTMQHLSPIGYITPTSNVKNMYPIFSPMTTQRESNLGQKPQQIRDAAHCMFDVSPQSDIGPLPQHWVNTACLL